MYTHFQLIMTTPPIDLDLIIDSYMNNERILNSVRSLYKGSYLEFFGAPIEDLYEPARNFYIQAFDKTIRLPIITIEAMKCKYNKNGKILDEHFNTPEPYFKWELCQRKEPLSLEEFTRHFIFCCFTLKATKEENSLVSSKKDKRDGVPSPLIHPELRYNRNKILLTENSNCQTKVGKEFLRSRVWDDIKKPMNEFIEFPSYTYTYQPRSQPLMEALS